MSGDAQLVERKQRARGKVMAAYQWVYGITCRLTPEDRDQLRNPKLVLIMGLPLPAIT